MNSGSCRRVATAQTLFDLPADAAGGRTIVGSNMAGGLGREQLRRRRRRQLSRTGSNSSSPDNGGWGPADFEASHNTGLGCSEAHPNLMGLGRLRTALSLAQPPGARSRQGDLLFTFSQSHRGRYSAAAARYRHHSSGRPDSTLMGRQEKRPWASSGPGTLMQDMWFGHLHFGRWGAGIMRMNPA